MWRFIPLLGAIINFLLVLFVVSRGMRTVIFRVYAMLGLGIVIWNTGTYFMFCVQTEAGAVFWARFLQLGVILMPLAQFHLSLLLGQVRIGKFIYLFYAFFAAFIVSDLTGVFIAGVRQVGYAYYSVAGPVFYIFLLSFTAMVLTSMYILGRKQRDLPPLHKSRLTNMILAQGMLAFFGVNDLMPILGIYSYPLTNFKIYPVGSIAAIFYGIIVGYSVFQHQLLDIRITLGRVSAHIVRFVFLFAITLALLMGVSILLPEQFTPASLLSVLTIFIVSALIASIFFPRLLGGGAELLERRVLGDRFEYHDKISAFIGLMQWQTDESQLLADLHHLLLNAVRVDSYQLVLLDDASHTFLPARGFPEEPRPDFSNLSIHGPVFRHFLTSKPEFLALNSSYAMLAPSDLEKEALKQLASSKAALCFPCIFGGDPLGLLFLGAKASDDPYTPTDIAQLSALTKNITAVIGQIRVKNQFLRAQEQELIGRMSRGMAHDLNNLLTPIGTCLQLAAEGAGIAPGAFNAELLPIALHNVKSIHAYIHEALFFSQNLRPDFHFRQIDTVLENAIVQVRNKLDRNRIKISLKIPAGLYIEMDEVLIQRLITNVISNAIDASTEGSTIELEVTTRSKPNSHCDWARIQAIDHGTGISAGNLDRIFMPYYTTKTSGDKTRGFGLGLAICRKIAHLHGGTMNILSSQPGGTTVNIDLPFVQAGKAEAVGV